METLTLSAADRALAEWESPHSGLFYVQKGVLNPIKTLGKYQWCGAFAAFCHSDLHPTLRKNLFPSTYRLSLYGYYLLDSNLWKFKLLNGVPIKTYHKANGGLRICTKDARMAIPGDIIITGKGPWGAHINICVGNSPSGIECVSGNGWGMRRDGTIGSGVVKNLYQPSQIRYVIRPAPADLDLTLIYS